tara:strand:- start:5847 stop:8300 length:2454 start_codon:yes stop_codon:yes gene_type:complete
MTEQSRKLAAIVFTDIVGFTKLSSENEPLAMETLSLQRDTLKPIVEKYNGEWLKEIGDGLLLSFQTSKEAVDCSIEIQNTIKNIANLNIRIGIHQGEVIIQNGDVLGDDVNIASRIETYAPSGGIVVTDRVHSSLARDPLYQSIDIGKPELKGVAQTINLFCLSSHGLPTIKNNLKKINNSKRSIKRNLPIYAGFFFTFSLMVLFLINKSFNNKAVNDLSIAVLPFANMSADKDNEYFSDGITEEILNSLAQIQELNVSARTSSFAFKGKNEDVRAIGKKLGVANVLEGSVRKFGDDIRVTAQLIRVGDGFHLWSDTYDRKFVDIFNVQKELSDAIANQLEVKLIGSNAVNKRSGTTSNPRALDLYMRGRFLWNQKKEEPLLKSIEHFKKALSLDSNYALSQAAIADAYFSLARIKRWTIDQSERNIILKNSEDNALKALEIDPSSGETYAVLGILYSGLDVSRDWKFDILKSEEYFKKSIELNPEYPTVYQWYSEFLRSEENYKKSKLMIDKALSLDPFSASINLTAGEFYSNKLGKLEEGLEYFDRAFDLDPSIIYGSANFAYTVLLERFYKWEKAEESWIHAYKTDSTFYGTLWGMTSHYLNRGMLDHAEKYFSKLLMHYPLGSGKMPSDNDTYDLAAYKYLCSDDFKNAQDAILSRVRFDPCIDWLLFDLSITFSRLNQIDRGLNMIDSLNQLCSQRKHMFNVVPITEDMRSRLNNFSFWSKTILISIEGDGKPINQEIEKLKGNDDLEIVSSRAHLRIFSKDYNEALDDFEILIDNFEPPRFFLENPIYDSIRKYEGYNKLIKKMNLESKNL